MLMKPPADKRIKRLWPESLAEQAPQLARDRARAIHLLEDALLRDHLPQSAVYFSELGRWRSSTGNSRLAAGEAEGMVDLEAFAFFRMLPTIINRVLHCADCGALAHVIVTGHLALARPSLEVLAVRVRAGDADEPFEALVLEVGARLGLVEAAVPARLLGLYAEPLDALADDARLAALLPGLCDEHLRRSSLATTSVAWFNVHYDLVPIELALLDHLRRVKHGLPALPAAEHPLLATPFAEVPHERRFEPTRDDRPDLWEMFVELARAKRPELDLTGA
jgi:hypothetical protein